MVTAEQERTNDIYDSRYGEDEDDLQPLERGMMSFRSMDDGGDDGEKYPFSKINAREAMITVDALYDFLKDYWPQSHKTRIHVNGLVRLCQRMLNAPANRRKLRFEIEEAKARYWQQRLGKEGEEHIKEADQLLDRWSSASLLQMSIRRRRLRNGLDAVDGERAKWHTADRKMELVEQLAAKLPASAHEYFECRLEQYRIERERAEDRAKGIREVDFSDLIVRIQDGKVTPAEVLESAPWPFKEAFDVCVQDASEENPHWKHNERMASASALGRRQPRSRWKGRDSGDNDAEG